MKNLYLTLVIAFFFATNFFSQNFEVGGIAYIITSSEVPYTVEVTSKTARYEGAIVVPEQVSYEEVAYSVTRIGDNAFKNSDLSSIVLPNSVTSIGNEAFSYCPILMTITIPNSVTTIGEGAFSYCTGLTNIEIPNTIATIADRIFQNCTGLTSVSIPNSVTTIGNSAFKGCNRLTNIDIPNTVTNIGDSAFEGCTKITSISIPNSVMNISNSAFWDCSDLISIDVDIDNEYYSSTDGVLYNKDKTLLLKYPENKAGGFLIPSSVLTVGDFAFSRSSGLTSIEFSNSLTTIGIWAFSWCTALQNIEFPNSVTSIGSDAFYGCSGLTTIEIPNSVTTMGSGAFWNCSGLTSIDVDVANEHYSSVDGVLYNKEKTLIIQYPESKEGDSFIIPNSVTDISHFAFRNCSRLVVISIPSTVKVIGTGSFEGCIGLTSVEIPNSVTNISIWAFLGCTGLTSITCYAQNPPDLGWAVFGDVTKDIPLYVPEASVSLYQQADQWNDFNISSLVTTSNTPNILNKINLYPNPVTDVLNIDMGGYQVEITYEIFNASGGFILSGKFAGTKTINTNGFESGIYIIQLKGDNWIDAKKFIKR